MSNDFAAFILTHKRPFKVKTYKTLRDCGYSGPIYLLVDDQDDTLADYQAAYPNQVIVFNKQEIAQTFDQGDNFQDYRAIIYARNACFLIAQKLGLKHFIQLDDDYVRFEHRFTEDLDYYPPTVFIKNLDKVFEALVEFHQQTPIHSIALCQGGDFIGGFESDLAQRIKLKRKCMNTFVCSTDRPFQFIGRINEDVNTYTRQASTGRLFFSANQVTIVQTRTQSNTGGMTDLYLDSGTYVKSFYTVMYQPSSVKIGILNSNHARIHHTINWKNTVPKILRQSCKKAVNHGKTNKTN